MRKIAILLLAAAGLLGIGALPSCASDIPINPTGPIYVLNGLVWGNSGPGGFNNNFWFSPLNPSQSVCVYVYNNNTTSAHTFKTVISVSANPSETAPSDGTWNTAAQWVKMNAPISPGVASNISASVSGAALVAVQFSGATTQSGSPETANVIITQTQGNCFSGQNTSIGSKETTVAFSPLQDNSQTLSNAFAVSAGTPAMGMSSDVLLNIQPAGSKSLYLSRLWIGNPNTGAISVALNVASTTGSMCTNLSKFNLNSSGSAFASTATVNNECATPPGTSQINLITIPAGETIPIDVSGIVLPSGQFGFDVTLGTSAASGMYVNLWWYEK